VTDKGKKHRNSGRSNKPSSGDANSEAACQTGNEISREKTGLAAGDQYFGKPAVVASSADLQKAAWRQMLRYYCPAGVIVDRHGRIVHFIGETGCFLQNPSGEPTLDLLSVVQPVLREAVRSVFASVVESGQDRVSREAFCRISPSSVQTRVQVEARPLPPSASDVPLYTVVFRPLSDVKCVTADTSEGARNRKENGQILRQLEENLFVLREDLLQVETEGRQLRALKDEIGAELDSLLSGFEGGVLVLDEGLRVRRFSSSLGKLLKMTDSDLGCYIEPAADETAGFQLVEDARQALLEETTVAREVQTVEEQWYLRRIVPYRSKDASVSGLIVTYSDVTLIKKVALAANQKAGFLQLLADALPVRMAYLDTEERYRYGNELYFSWLGMPREKVLGKTLMEVLGQETYTQVSQYVKRALAGKRSRLEIGLQYASAGFRQVLLECAPHFDEKGKVIGVFGVVFDISERKESERNNAWLAAIVQSSADAVISKDFDGTVRSWNRAAELIYGYSAEEMVGGNISRIFSPEMVEDMEAIIARLREGQRVPPFETKRLRKDGTVIDVMLTLSPILDSNGVAVAVSAISSDISGRKAMESALRERELLHRTIGETVPFGTWTADVSGRWTHVADIFLRTSGMTMEQAAGFGWLEMVPEAERQRVKGEWLRSIESGEDWNCEFRFQGADGKLYDIFSIGRPVRDEAGALLYWAGFHLDNTAQKRVEKELQELNRTLELKIAERTNALEQHMVQLRRLTLELTQTEERERQRLAKVLHDDLQQLLVAAALRVERLETKIVDENLQDILFETEDLLGRASSTARNLAVDLRPPVPGDANLLNGLRRLVDWIWQRFDLAVHLEIIDNFDSNLISAELAAYLLATARELLFNVVKHSQVKNATLHLGLDEMHNLRLAVLDQGVGCKAEDIWKEENSSIGTGLRTTRERLQLMGGDFNVRTGPGKGFQVEISMPFLSGDEKEKTEDVSEGARQAGEAVEKKPAGQRSSEQRIRIMLVDDHSIVRDGLRMILQEEGDFEVVAEAANGGEALVLAMEKRPDVVIMDINMPEMNGIVATRLIKKKMAATRIIALSINDDSTSINAMREAGACGYHLKSGPAEKLCSIIRSCVREQEAGAPAA